MEYSISCTTRAPRGEEEDGLDYHFLTVARFRELIAESAGVSVVHAAEDIEVAGGRAFRFLRIENREEAGAAEGFRNVEMLFRKIVCMYTVRPRAFRFHFHGKTFLKP